jgi:magnesium transporter
VTGFLGQNFGWLIDHIGSLEAFALFGLGGLLVAAAWLVAVLHLSGELTRRKAAEDVAEKVTP